ncbi:YybH family protein [Gaetbulibacter saemankumensis]|uniref:YybH family protein n=1 Tax=Gaetbulibacter saemankumensis TaxID=311208 RepID=UPI0009FBF52F|nr:nuclear transport factor 2 family protein [Gaetbulibacter saemankumensis]
MKSPVILFSFLIMSCTSNNKQQAIQQWQSEILTVEKSFNTMVQSEGIAKAFEHFAAPDAVILRGEALIKGKKAICTWYRDRANPHTTLTWTPNYVDVSDSGDMAYTYGDYTYTAVDSLGNKNESKGIFHTVWKRQTDGSWKFVYD